MFSKKANVDDIHVTLNPLDSGCVYVTLGGDEAIEVSIYDLTFHLVKMACVQSLIGNTDEAKKCLAAWGDCAQHMSKMIAESHKRISDKAFLKVVLETKEISHDALNKLFFSAQN